MIETSAATAADAEALTALVNSAYRGDSGMRSWTTEAHFIGGQRVDAEWVRELTANSDTVILLARDSGKLVGCVQLRREGEECYLGMLTVAPDLQRGGLGSQLLAAAEVEAKRRFQSRAMWMNVISIRTELIDWYLRRGYIDSGQRSKFPYGDERFGKPQRNDLEFVVLKKSLA